MVNVTNGHFGPESSALLNGSSYGSERFTKLENKGGTTLEQLMYSLINDVDMSSRSAVS